MIPVQDSPISQLPIVPVHVLMQHRVFEEFDNRFRSCARLLQALWRERQELPIGTFTNSSGRKRRIGSMISTAAAEEGRNFLTPAIAALARLEIAYQERGALIDKNRLFSNLLSSMPLAFNIAAPWRIDHDLAAKVIRGLIPTIDMKAVTNVWFEHSPGRKDPTLTGDRTAFDIAVVYERGDGQQGFIGIEVKYSESGNEPAPPELNARYDELAPASGLYLDPNSAELRVNPLQQIFREHLLAQACLMRGDYAESYFMLIAPRHNHLVQNSAARYQTLLTEPADGQTPFVNVHLEQVIEAYGWAGEQTFAEMLHRRYTDWWQVDAVVRAALLAQGKDWLINPPRLANTVALIGKAA